jgi:hypothetical protein
VAPGLVLLLIGACIKRRSAPRRVPAEERIA